MPPETGILTTKLHRPRITDDLIPRPRLLAQLERSHGNPLILTAAPAGYGKSTLLASWLGQVDCPNAWISLDEYDNDLEAFLLYFLTAVDSLFPGKINHALAILSLRELPPLRDLAGLLINELMRIDQNFILVLDDYHYITEVAIHDLINQLLLHPPRGMQLVLVTRSDPPLSLVRLRSKGLLTEIRTRQLRFTEDETQTLLEQLLQVSFDRKDVQVIDREFEGWVTGLRLAALTMRDQSRAEEVMARMQGDSKFVRDYLISEVTAQLPTPVRDFLVKTAILDRLNGPLCDAVMGWDEQECNGQSHLEWLLKINLFMVPLDENGNWFRYHNLMREYLQQELVRDFDVDEISELHLRASAWLAQNGWVDEAIQYALMAGDSETAAHLSTQHRHDLIDQEQWHRLDAG